VSFAVYHEYQRRHIRKHHYQDPSKVMLPILQSMLNLFIIVHAVLAVCSSLTQLGSGSVCGTLKSSLFIAAGSALYHMIYEGTAIFLSRYGIGWGALRASLVTGMLWGSVSFVFILVLADAICHAIGIPFLTNYIDVAQASMSGSGSGSGSNPSLVDSSGYSLVKAMDLALPVFLFFKLLLLVYYGVLWLAPAHAFYRRPAAVYYAKWTFWAQIYSVVAACVFNAAVGTSVYEDAVCVLTITSSLLVAVVYPYIVNQAFVQDSVYWQGLMVAHDNPVAALTLQNDVATASAMAQKVGELSTGYLFRRQQVNVLHFGMLSLDRSKGFVSGGYSRVYFGRMRAPAAESAATKAIGTFISAISGSGSQKQSTAGTAAAAPVGNTSGRADSARSTDVSAAAPAADANTLDVAIKVIYAMELSPFEIKALCSEAQILAELSHPNIIHCHGVCVMPPALALVFELCEHGSLFTFLFKPVSVSNYEDDDDSDYYGIRASTSASTSSHTSHRNLGDMLGSHMRNVGNLLSSSHSISSSSRGSSQQQQQQLLLRSSSRASTSSNTSSNTSNRVSTSTSNSAFLTRISEQKSHSQLGQLHAARGSLGVGLVLGKGQIAGLNPMVEGRWSQGNFELSSMRLSVGVGDCGELPPRLSADAGIGIDIDSCRLSWAGTGAGGSGMLGSMSLSRSSSAGSALNINAAVASTIPLIPRTGSAGTVAALNTNTFNPLNTVPEGRSSELSQVSCGGTGTGTGTGTGSDPDVELGTAGVAVSVSAGGSRQKSSEDVSVQMTDMRNSTQQQDPAPAAAPAAPATAPAAPHSLATLASGVSLSTRLHMMRGCARAVAFLHSKSFVHCDIKSLNFLVSSDHSCKLADMGDARVAGQPRDETAPLAAAVPSRNWAAPELLAQGADVFADYTAACDVYGLGIVLSELATLRMPYTDEMASLSPQDWHERIQDESFRPLLSGSAEAQALPAAVLAVIERCWCTDASKRCSAAEVLAVLEQGE